MRGGCKSTLALSMKKLGNIFAYLIVLAGFPFIWWLIYYSASQTFMFWQHGAEKQAIVVALDHISSSTKSGFGFHYTLNIEGHTVVKGFRHKLPISSSISVLVLSDRPNEDEITMGKKDSGPFEIFSNSVGGDITAILSILLFVPLAAASPFLFTALFKGRRHFIEN